ncbi:serine/threonine-protein kinase [Nannocystis sp.]|uniref:serine/threonine-protein kinase n=1 Tax=Nannocystis sp. TaxID=1962667 RepID=UPI0025DF337E|nr:serine/threonine-protein kinase [Nannocystis sp.]MBK7826404.1 protein kinase [Nannocystis sp.]
MSSEEETQTAGAITPSGSIEASNPMDTPSDDSEPGELGAPHHLHGGHGADGPDPGESSQFLEFASLKRFTIRRRIGAGGMGVVYEAIDRERGETVAVKTLLNVSPGALYRFKREFRLLADVTHPNLIALHELFFEGEQIFFSMEYVDGLSFVEYVRGTDSEDGPEDPEIRHERLRAALRQLAAGLGVIHGAGMLHRDIKPSNILLTREGRLVVLDFGLVSESVTETLRSTAAGAMIGTPGYLSPEQAAGQPASVASDWYAVGVMMFVALTGELPFRGKGLKVLLAKQERDAPAPGSLAPGLPPDLEALCVDLLQRDPSKRPGAADVLRRVGTGPSGIRPRDAVRRDAGDLFLGRELHLRALQDAFAATHRGRAVAIKVGGRSGMGKSALVREFLARLHRSDRAVALVGRCYERESVSFKALDSLVDALCQHLMRLPDARAAELMPRDILALARVFPVLQRVKAVSQSPPRVGESPEPRELRRRAFAALKELLARLADRKSLVLHIDDLQWGDRDSAALLADLLRPPDAPALLLIASYRSEASNGAVLGALGDATRGEVDMREIDVGPLSEEEAADLALQLLAEKAPQLKGRARQIAHEAQGSPLFVRELVRYAIAGGARPGEVSLDQVLLARLEALPPAARGLLEVVAVAGGPVDVRLAAVAAGVVPEARTALATLRGEHLVLTGDENAVETYHDRIREVVLGRLGTEGIRERHRQLAFAMEAAGDRDSDALALHFREAGEWERAADYAQMAAEQAAANLAFDRAARLYRLALEFKPQNDPGRGELTCRLADALANAGRGVKAAKLYLAAAAVMPAEAGLDLRRRATGQLLRAGQIAEGSATMRKVVAEVGLAIPTTPRGMIAALTYERARLKLRGLTLREREPASVDRAELARMAVCRTIASSVGIHDPLLAALFQARHLNLAFKTGHVFHAAIALAGEVGYASIRGEGSRERAERTATQATALAQRLADPLPRGLLALSRGIAAFHFGRWQEAIGVLDRAEQILRGECVGTGYEITTAQAFRLVTMFMLGEMRTLGARMANFIAEARERDDAWADTFLRAGPQVGYWLADDDLPRARAELTYVQQRWPDDAPNVPRLWTFVGAMHIDFYAGEAAAAWARVGREWDDFSRSFMFQGQWTRVMLHALRAGAALGRLHADHGESERAGLLRAVEADLDGLKGERTLWATPFVELVNAGLLVVNRQKDRAVQGLRAAEQGFRAVDMALYAEAARRRCGQFLGGSEGSGLVGAADMAMSEHGVRRPERMTRALAPGFPDA